MVALQSRLDKNINKADDTVILEPCPEPLGNSCSALPCAQPSAGGDSSLKPPPPRARRLPEQLQGGLIETHRPPVSGPGGSQPEADSLEGRL